MKTPPADQLIALSGMIEYSALSLPSHISPAMHKRLKIESFAILGSGEHGALAKAVLEAGLRPALMLALDEASNTILSADPGPDANQQVMERLDAGTCRELMTRHKVDALLLDGELKAENLDRMALEKPVLKLHLAPLPAYRGKCAMCWALYHDEPLEVCAQLLASDLDMGPILSRSPLPVYRGDALADIEKSGREAGVALLVDVLCRARSEGLPIALQEPWEGRVFPDAMPDDIYRELTRRLAAQEYSHYA